MLNLIKKHLPNILANFVILDFATFIYVLTFAYINESNPEYRLSNAIIYTVFLFIMYQPAILLCSLIAYLISSALKTILKYKNEVIFWGISFIVGILIIAFAALPYDNF